MFKHVYIIIKIKHIKILGNKKGDETMKKKIWGYLLTALFVGASLGGCGSTTSKETSAAASSTPTTSEVTAATSQTINYAIWSSPKGVFNPVLLNDIYDRRVGELVFSSLLTLDADDNIIPALAESYEVSEDNLKITFKLRSNVTWHDGKPFTAKDVAFTFTSIADPNYTGPRFAEIEKLVGAQDYRDGKADTVTGIEVIDEQTISFTYSEVYAAALANFAIRGILPEHIWGAIPVREWEKQTELLTKPIGTGAFKLVNFVPDQYVELVRNDDYFLGAPKLEKVILKVSNQETAQGELVNGTLDIAALSSFKQQDLDTYTSAGKKILEYPSASYQFMTMNNENPLFADKRVRQAITYAINREGLVNQLLEGHGAIINAPLAVSSWAYPKEGLADYTYDTAKAQSLLAEAGWTVENGVLQKEGTAFKVELLVPTGNKVREQSAPIIQQNLKDLGIEVNISTMDFASVKAKVYEEHSYEMALMGFSLELDPADAKSYWSSELLGKPSFNFANFNNVQSDTLLNQAAQSLNQDERKVYYNEWAKLLNEEVPFVYLYSPNEARAYNPNIKGYNFSNYIEFPNIHEWTLE